MQKIVDMTDAGQNGLAVNIHAQTPAVTAGMTELEEAELTDGQGRALPHIKRRAPMPDMPSELMERGAVRSSRPASVTRIASRTRRIHNFERKRGNSFETKIAGRECERTVKVMKGQ